MSNKVSPTQVSKTTPKSVPGKPSATGPSVGTKPTPTRKAPEKANGVQQPAAPPRKQPAQQVSFFEMSLNDQAKPTTPTTSTNGHAPKKPTQVQYDGVAPARQVSKPTVAKQPQKAPIAGTPKPTVTATKKAEPLKRKAEASVEASGSESATTATPKPAPKKAKVGEEGKAVPKPAPATKTPVPKAAQVPTPNKKATATTTTTTVAKEVPPATETLSSNPESEEHSLLGWLMKNYAKHNETPAPKFNPAELKKLTPAQVQEYQLHEMANFMVPSNLWKNDSAFVNVDDMLDKLLIPFNKTEFIQWMHSSMCPFSNLCSPPDPKDADDERNTGDYRMLYGIIQVLCLGMEIQNRLKDSTFYQYLRNDERQVSSEPSWAEWNKSNLKQEVKLAKVFDEVTETLNQMKNENVYKMRNNPKMGGEPSLIPELEEKKPKSQVSKPTIEAKGKAKPTPKAPVVAPVPKKASSKKKAEKVEEEEEEEVKAPKPKAKKPVAPAKDNKKPKKKKDKSAEEPEEEEEKSAKSSSKKAAPKKKKKISKESQELSCVIREGKEPLIIEEFTGAKDIKHLVFEPKNLVLGYDPVKRDDLLILAGPNKLDPSIEEYFERSDKRKREPGLMRWYWVGWLYDQSRQTSLMITLPKKIIKDVDRGELKQGPKCLPSKDAVLLTEVLEGLRNPKSEELSTSTKWALGAFRNISEKQEFEVHDAKNLDQILSGILKTKPGSTAEETLRNRTIHCKVPTRCENQMTGKPLNSLLTCSVMRNEGSLNVVSCITDEMVTELRKLKNVKAFLKWYEGKYNPVPLSEEKEEKTKSKAKPKEKSEPKKSSSSKAKGEKSKRESKRKSKSESKKAKSERTPTEETKEYNDLDSNEGEEEGGNSQPECDIEGGVPDETASGGEELDGFFDEEEGEKEEGEGEGEEEEEGEGEEETGEPLGSVDIGTVTGEDVENNEELEEEEGNDNEEGEEEQAEPEEPEESPSENNGDDDIEQPVEEEEKGEEVDEDNELVSVENEQGEETGLGEEEEEAEHDNFDALLDQEQNAEEEGEENDSQVVEEGEEENVQEDDESIEADVEDQLSNAQKQAFDLFNI